MSICRSPKPASRVCRIRIAHLCAGSAKHLEYGYQSLDTETSDYGLVELGTRSLGSCAEGVSGIVYPHDDHLTIIQSEDQNHLQKTLSRLSKDSAEFLPTISFLEYAWFHLMIRLPVCLSPSSSQGMLWELQGFSRLREKTSAMPQWTDVSIKQSVCIGTLARAIVKTRNRHLDRPAFQCVIQSRKRNISKAQSKKRSRQDSTYNFVETLHPFGVFLPHGPWRIACSKSLIARPR